MDVVSFAVRSNYSSSYKLRKYWPRQAKQFLRACADTKGRDQPVQQWIRALVVRLPSLSLSLDAGIVEKNGDVYADSEGPDQPAPPRSLI